MLWTLQDWATVASVGAAWIALVLSVLNFRTSRKALYISEQQEARRSPSLVPYLLEGYVSVGSKPNSRVYAFLISLSNRSDNDNAIAEATLRLTYVKTGEIEFTVKIGAGNDFPTVFADKSAIHLQLPIRIDAHQTISGWCFFTVDAIILDGAQVERTLVAFIDSHGNETNVEPLIIREYGIDVQALSG